MLKCKKCGVAFEKERKKRPGVCPACIRAYDREYYQAHRPERNQERGKVEILAVSPFIKDAEERYSLSVYVKTRPWPIGEFRKNVKVGNFNGLRVKFAGKVYDVRRCQMKAVAE